MSIAVVLVVRYLLVVLFFPFSALDKIIGFRGAVGQAAEAVGKGGLAVGLVLAGLAVEIFMPLGILTGIADRLAAFIMAGYCGVTALLWKQWWQPGDFWARRRQQGPQLVLGLPEEVLARWRVLTACIRLAHRRSGGLPV